MATTQGTIEVAEILSLVMRALMEMVAETSSTCFMASYSQIASRVSLPVGFVLAGLIKLRKARVIRVDHIADPKNKDCARTFNVDFKEDSIDELSERIAAMDGRWSPSCGFEVVNSFWRVRHDREEAEKNERICTLLMRQQADAVAVLLSRANGTCQACDVATSDLSVCERPWLDYRLCGLPPYSPNHWIVLCRQCRQILERCYSDPGTEWNFPE